MRERAVNIGTALAIVAGIVITSAQTVPTKVDGLVMAAKVAAGADAPPPRERWH